MADDREYSNIYTIPPNYTDSGKLMGGMLETRNTVEAGILLALVGYPELMWLHLPVTAKVVVMTITLLPLGVFALMGLGGDSLLQYVSHMVMFLVRRRQLHYRRIGYHYGTNTNKGRSRKKQPPEKEGGQAPCQKKNWSSFRTSFRSKSSKTASSKPLMAGLSRSWRLSPSTSCSVPTRSSGGSSPPSPAG